MRDIRVAPPGKKRISALPKGLALDLDSARSCSVPPRPSASARKPLARYSAPEGALARNLLRCSLDLVRRSTERPFR
jgi:hypothetical protein